VGKLVVEDLEGLELEVFGLLPDFERTHPSGLEGLWGGKESVGVLFDRGFFMRPEEDEVFLLRWCVRYWATFLSAADGTRDREEWESLRDSCSKVFIACT
jgi:hypothetical protein